MYNYGLKHFNPNIMIIIIETISKLDLKYYLLLKLQKSSKLK